MAHRNVSAPQLSSAIELLDVVRLAGTKVMVGYMKRYDPGYLAGLGQLAAINAYITCYNQRGLAEVIRFQPAN